MRNIANTKLETGFNNAKDKAISRLEYALQNGKEGKMNHHSIKRNSNGGYMYIDDVIAKKLESKFGDLIKYLYNSGERFNKDHANELISYIKTLEYSGQDLVNKVIDKMVR